MVPVPLGVVALLVVPGFLVVALVGVTVVVAVPGALVVALVVAMSDGK